MGTPMKRRTQGHDTRLNEFERSRLGDVKHQWCSNKIMTYLLMCHNQTTETNVILVWFKTVLHLERGEVLEMDLVRLELYRARLKEVKM